MKFYEFGDKSLPHIMLIHGGGWSECLYLREARLMQNRYHVILPLLDGHGDERNNQYISTEDEADKIIEYINSNCDGKLFAISGVSLGAQIVIEVLSKKNDVAKKAIVESGVCIPSKAMLNTTKIIYKFFRKFIYSEKFNRWGIKFYPESMQLPAEIKEMYLKNISAMKNNEFFLSYFNYKIKDSLRECVVDTEYWYGSKEVKLIKESAHLFKKYMKKCEIIELKGYNHAEISAYKPEEWVMKAEQFFDK